MVLMSYGIGRLYFFYLSPFSCTQPIMLSVLPILCLFACPSPLQMVSTRGQSSCPFISVDTDSSSV